MILDGLEEGGRVLSQRARTVFKYQNQDLGFDTSDHVDPSFTKDGPHYNRRRHSSGI